MTPKFYFKISKVIVKHESTLAKVCLLLIVIFISALVFFANEDSETAQLFIGPFLSIPAIIGGVLFVYAWFGRIKARDTSEFDKYWESSGLIKKVFYWYGSLFFSVWFIGILFVSLFSTHLAVQSLIKL